MVYVFLYSYKFLVGSSELFLYILRGWFTAIVATIVPGKQSWRIRVKSNETEP